jgi:hypothetical protein
MAPDAILIIFLAFWACQHAYYRHCRDKVEDVQFRVIARLLQKVAGETDDTWNEKREPGQARHNWGSHLSR